MKNVWLGAGAIAVVVIVGLVFLLVQQAEPGKAPGTLQALSPTAAALQGREDALPGGNATVMPVDSSPTGRRITVTFAVWDEERGAYDPVISAFEAQNPDIRIRVVSLNKLVPVVTVRSDEETTLTVQDAVVSLPQVVSGADTAVVAVPSEAFAKGYVRDLRPFMDGDPTFDSTDFAAGVLQAVSVNSSTFMLPSYLDIPLLSYNKDLWAASGLQPPAPDWTWADVISAAQKLARKESDNVRTYGFLGGGEGVDALLSEIGASGVDLDPPDGLALDQPAIVAAVERIASLARAGAVFVAPTPGPVEPGAKPRAPGDFAQQLVLSGKVAMWSPNLMMGREAEITFGTGVVPYPSAPVGIEGYIMSGGARYPQEAWRWLNFLSRRQIASPLSPEAQPGRLPARGSIAKSSGYWDGLSAETRKAVETVLSKGAAAGLVRASWYRFDSSRLLPVLQTVLMQEQSAAEALRAAQATFDNYAFPEAAASGPLVVQTPLPESAGTQASTRTNVGNGNPSPTPLSDAALAGMGIDQFLEAAFLDLMLRDPERYTELGLPAAGDPNFRNDSLTDLSDAYTRETNARVSKYLERLRAYDRSRFSKEQALSADLFEWYLDDLKRGQEFMYYDYLVNPVFGVQNNIVDLLANVHPLNNKEQADAYVARLKLFPAKFNGLLEVLRIREAKGLIPPRSMIRRLLGEMSDFVAVPAQENTLYTSFKARVEPLESISGTDKAVLYQAVEAAIQGQVYPAYQSLRDYLGQLEMKGRDTDGVWALPNGDAYYAYALRRYTTTDLTPEEVHQQGLTEMRRVQGELRAELDKLGFRGLSLRDGVRKVAEAGGIEPVETQAERDKVLVDYQAILERAEQGLGAAFDLQPKAQVRILSVPQYREANAPLANYVPPALDGTRPGATYINQGKPVPVYQMPGLIYHEGIPGHHFQIGIQTELAGVPTFRRVWITSGFAEGWAAYTEGLAFELGFYDGDLYGNVARLQGQLARALRMVVDTGIHYKRWTRRQAIDFMRENGVSPEGALMSEVDRYIAWPGQAPAYGVGQLKIVELRERARAALGDKLDFKEFHNVVLQNGGISLTILEQVVNDYIASKGQSLKLNDQRPMR